MLITLTGASGVGKTTIMRHLMRIDREVKPLSSTTTRKPRRNDVEGEYEYITDGLFKIMVERGKFLWSVQVHGNNYGTRADLVRASLLPDFKRIAPVTHEAVRRLHAFAEEYGRQSQLISVYILSPGEDILRERLMHREPRPTEDEIERRITECLPWDLEAKSSRTPYRFVQDKNNLEEKVGRVRKLFLH